MGLSFLVRRRQRRAMRTQAMRRTAEQPWRRPRWHGLASSALLWPLLAVPVHAQDSATAEDAPETESAATVTDDALDDASADAVSESDAATSAAAGPLDPAAGPDNLNKAVGNDGPQALSGRPEWRWRQVLSTPRIGGRMTAITVDPRDPRRVFVGTEEGTLLRSTDAGATWREIEMNPVIVQDRTLTLLTPGLPSLGTTTPSPLRIFFDPPFMKFLDRIFVTGVELVQFSTLPEGIVVGFIPVGLGVPQDLLALATRPRRFQTTPVRRIAVCPGAEYELLAATKYELFGSMDDGMSYVRVFGLPGVELLHVVCSPVDPNEVYLATGFGLFRSRDGGLTFDQILVGWPGAPATAVAFAPAKKGEPLNIFAAWGSGLWAGDPDSDQGLRMLYPDFKDSSTAPWADIRWIDVTEKGQIWMATDDGVRVSYDGGKQWVAEARSLFERQQARQVVVGPTESGGERVAVMLRDFVYATDDGGRSWHPFFNGLTRRAHKQMASSRRAPGVTPGWWMLTGGDLWTTVAPEEDTLESGDRRAVRWALRKLRRTPPMQEIIDKLLDRTLLSRPQINAFTTRAKKRNWAPILSGSIQGVFRDKTLGRRQFVTAPAIVERRDNQPTIEAFAQLVWSTKGFAMADEELGGFQLKIQNLGNQVRFIAEDAWHERVMLLRKIAAGESDAAQTEVLRTRVEALEAILELWMRAPLERAPARRRGRRRGPRKRTGNVPPPS